MTSYVHTCGCRFTASERNDCEIIHCPMHAKAPEMRDTLREIAKRYGWNNPGPGADSHPIVRKTCAILNDLEG